MRMINTLYIFIISFILVFLLTPVVIKIAKKHKLFDLPGEHKIHSEPIPRIGGIAFYLAFALIVIYIIVQKSEISLPLLQMIGIFLASTLMVAVGIIDDLKGGLQVSKVIAALFSGLILIFCGIKIGFFPAYISIPLTLFWVAGITASVNIIDGLDGLAAGISFIASIFFLLIALIQGQTLVAVLAVIIAGSTLGFLKYNFYPAKIFMGDTGSMFLGFILAVLGILLTMKSISFWKLFVPPLILGVPVLDAFLTIVRRYSKKKSILEVDRSHFYDILMLRQNMNHKQAVAACWLLGLGFGGLALLMSHLLTG